MYVLLLSNILVFNKVIVVVVVAVRFVILAVSQSVGQFQNIVDKSYYQRRQKSRAKAVQRETRLQNLARQPYYYRVDNQYKKSHCNYCERQREN